MTRISILLGCLLCSTSAFASGRVLLGAGAGIHRYLDASDDGSYVSSRFVGSYLNGYVGTVTERGGLFALDLTRTVGEDVVRTDRSELRLRMQNDSVAALAGMEMGALVRFQLALLGGITLGRYDRSLEQGLVLDERVSHDARLLFGGQVGLDVAPLPWLSVGARGRLAFTLGDDDRMDAGGSYFGLNVEVLL